MFLRLTYLYFAPENATESKQIYLSEIAPVIRDQEGNKDVCLLESHDGSDEYISSTLWENESDLRTFEESSIYQTVIGRVKEIVTKPPSQKYYLVSE